MTDLRYDYYMPLSTVPGDVSALRRAFGDVVSIPNPSLGGVYAWAVEWLPRDALVELVVTAVRERAHDLGPEVDEDLTVRYVLDALSRQVEPENASWVARRVLRAMRAREERVPQGDLFTHDPSLLSEAERFWWGVLAALTSLCRSQPDDRMAWAVLILLGTDRAVTRVYEALAGYGHWARGAWEQN